MTLGPHRDPIHVAVCICTRNRPDELKGSLASIDRSGQSVAQVVVSDDGDDPRTPEVCAAATLDVVYAAGPRRGLGPNRNAALRHVTAPYVLFLDDDCLLHPDFVELASATMTDQEREHGRGRVILTGSESNDGHIVVAHDQSFLGFQDRPYAPSQAMHSIVINATVFPATVFEALRFDDHLVYGYDEVDLASRAVARGFTVAQMQGAPNDHRHSPRSRADYMGSTPASRLYVTFKRYAYTERRPLKATAFAIFASLHLLASMLRREGVRGTPHALRTVGRAVGYVRGHLRDPATGCHHPPI